MSKLLKLASEFLKISSNLIDDSRANKICNNFLLVPEGHDKYQAILDATKSLLSKGEAASNLLTMHILNAFDMPDITPSKNLDNKILEIQNLLDEDDLVNILNDTRFKHVKQFMNHKSPKVRQVAFSRLGVKDKDSQILELEELRYQGWPMNNKDQYRSRLLSDMLRDKMVGPEDMPKLIKYFDNKLAPFSEYFLLFKKYVSSIHPSQAGKLLEDHPDFPASWEFELKRKAGAPDEALHKVVDNAKNQGKKLMDSFQLQFGNQNKKLN
jgi:hypothetical protein